MSDSMKSPPLFKSFLKQLKTRLPNTTGMILIIFLKINL